MQTRNKPFVDEREFLATISDGKQRIEGVQVRVEYSLDEPGAIKGEVFGDVDMASRIFSLRPEPFVSIRSMADERFASVVRSSKVHITQQIHHSQYPEFVAKLRQVCAQFEMEEILIRRRPVSREPEEMVHATFFLAGPTEDWQGRIVRRTLLDGRIEVEGEPMILHLEEQPDWVIELRPVYLYDRSSKEMGDPDLMRRVGVLHFICDPTCSGFSMRKFARDSRRLADSICILMSLASRRRISWHRCEFLGANRIFERVRKTRPCPTLQLFTKDYLVNVHSPEAREFLEQSLPVLRQHKSLGRDLSDPILTYLDAREADQWNQRFMLYFMALETIRELHTRDQDSFKTVPDRGVFTRLRDRLAEVVDEMLADQSQAYLVKQKLSDLRRKSIRSVLESMFTELAVPWQDCGVASERTSGMAFIKTRHELFHGSHDASEGWLPHDSLWLESLVECTILRLLGWQDVSRCLGRNWFR